MFQSCDSAKQLARACGEVTLASVDSYYSGAGEDQMAKACVFDSDTICHISFDQRGGRSYLQSETLTPPATCTFQTKCVISISSPL